MSVETAALALIDNGGRRLGDDRRKFSYTVHIPNKRTIEDRRSGIDRRGNSDRRNNKNRKLENDLREGIDRRSGLERRVAFLICSTFINNDLRERADRRSDLKKVHLMRKNSLKKIRESILMSKAELARKANISQATISRIEQGLPCRMETQRKIIKALGYKLSDKDKIFPKD